MKVKVCDLLSLVVDSYKEIIVLDSNNKKIMVVDSHEYYKFGENYDLDVSKVEGITLHSNCLIITTDYKEENFKEDDLRLYKAYRDFDSGASDECYMIYGDNYGCAENHFLKQTQFDEDFEYDLDVTEAQDDLNEVFEYKDVMSIKDLYEKYGTDLFW